MKALQENDVIRAMREEWAARIGALREQVDVVMNSKVGKEGDVPVISPGLKVMHKKSGIRYTVTSVGPRDVILKTPEGEDFLVDGPEFESAYKLD
jgi:hypothetical protein